jgi:hypothetical protein
MINADSASVSLPALKFLRSPVEVRVLLLRFGRLRVESLRVPVDQRSGAVHRSMLLVSSTRLAFVLLSQPRLFDGKSAFRVGKSHRTLMDPLTPAFRTHDGHQTMMPPPVSAGQSQRSQVEVREMVEHSYGLVVNGLPPSRARSSVGW